MAAPSSTELVMLGKFQERLSDLSFDTNGNSNDSQMFLLRFLRARNHNLTKAEDMLRKHLEWLQVNKIDTILEWTPPSLLSNGILYDVAGVDKEGCPVFVGPFGTWDVRHVVDTGLKQAYIKYVDQLFLNVMKAMERSSNLRGSPVTQFVCIMVPDDFQAFRQLSSPAAVDAVLEIVRRFEANYPETLKAAFVIDASPVINLIVNLVKPLLNSTTLGKFTFSTNENEWKPALRKLIEEDQLCIRLGGTMPSKVPILNFPRGEYKSRKQSVCEDNDDFLAVTIGARQSFKIQQDISGTSQIRWTFKIGNHDIGFSVTFGDNNEEVVPYSRIISNATPHSGGILCEKPGKYLLIFDNTFSRFRSKVLHYKVSVDRVGTSNLSLEEESGSIGHSFL